MTRPIVQPILLVWLRLVLGFAQCKSEDEIAYLCPKLVVQRTSPLGLWRNIPNALLESAIGTNLILTMHGGLILPEHFYVSCYQPEVEVFSGNGTPAILRCLVQV